MGAFGVDPVAGITGANLLETQTDRAIVAAAADVVVLADSSKFFQRGPVRIADTTEITTLVTDSDAPAEVLERVLRRGRGGRHVLTPTAELVAAAAAAGVGVPAFNGITVEHAEAIVAGAEAAGRPVILAAEPQRGALPRGPRARSPRRYRAIAEDAAVPVGLHLDHVEDLALVEEAARLGLRLGHVRRRGPALRRNVARPPRGGRGSPTTPACGWSPSSARSAARTALTPRSAHRPGRGGARTSRPPASTRSPSPSARRTR